MSENHRHYKYTVFLSMLYFAILTYTVILTNKDIQMPFGYTSAGQLTFPLFFILNDIIAEVYGYKFCRRMLWVAFFLQFLVTLYCLGIIHLPAPLAHKNKSDMVIVILGDLFRRSLNIFVAFILSGILNIYFLTKWKILTQGKYFWLRSIGSSGLGIIFYGLLIVPMTVMGRVPFSEMKSLIFWSITVKTFCVVDGFQNPRKSSAYLNRI